MQITPGIAASLFGYSTTNTATTLANLAAGLAPEETPTGPRIDPITALSLAEKNHDKEVARKAKDPIVRREIEQFRKAVGEAKSVDALLKDRRVTNVLLTANGLEDYVNYPGLISKSLKSDLDEPKSAANQLASTQPGWKAVVEQFKFSEKGLAEIKKAGSIDQIASAYIETRWRQDLDKQAPGVSFALTFKELAATLKTPYHVLGNAVARAVVTEAFGIPPQIAYQPLETQAKVIDRAVDVEKFGDKKYVDSIARRYLIQKNITSAGGLTA